MVWARGQGGRAALWALGGSPSKAVLRAACSGVLRPLLISVPREPGRPRLALALQGPRVWTQSEALDTRKP